MAKPPAKAVRLPSGKYAWRGRAVSFSRLPKAERSRFRASWAAKGARKIKEPAGRPVKGAGGQRRPRGAGRVPERRPRGPAPTKASARKTARAWLDRRTKKVGKGEAPDKILATLGPKAVLGLREVQRAAHEAYKGKGERGRARAARIAEQAREALGAELAAAMPQLWFYH